MIFLPFGGVFAQDSFTPGFIVIIILQSGAYLSKGFDTSYCKNLAYPNKIKKSGT